VKKYQQKMAKKCSDLDKVLSTAYAFINNGIEPDGVLDAETRVVVLANSCEIIKSADAVAKKTVKGLIELEEQLGEKLKERSVSKRHHYEKMDKIDREQLDEEIASYEDSKQFLMKKRSLMDDSRLYMALDMAKKICTVHIATVPIVEPMPACLGGGGGGGGASSSSSIPSFTGAGGGGASRSTLGEFKNLDLNGIIFYILPSFCFYFLCQAETTDNSTTCENCDKITTQLHVLTNPFGTSAYWALCDDCATVYHK